MLLSEHAVWLYSRPGSKAYLSRYFMVYPKTHVIASKIELLEAVATRAAQRQLRFGELLQAARLVTPAQVEQALGVQNQRQQRIGEALIEMGALKPLHLSIMLARHRDPLTVDLSRYPLNAAALSALPPKFAHKTGALPVELHDGVLYVASKEELSDDTCHLIACSAKVRQVQRVVASAPEQIALLISRRYTHPDSITFAADHSGVLRDTAASTSKSDPGLRALLAYAIAHNASDIHVVLRNDSPTSVIKLRIDGTLVPFQELDTVIGTRLIRQLEHFAGMPLARPGTAREGQLSIYSDGALISLRISIIPGAVGDSVVLRLMDARNFKSNIGELRLPPEQDAMLRALVEKPYGLLLMTGPTGSGKTSTLYTLLKHVQGAGGRHLTTVEDPVEYILPDISQFSTSNFAQSLKLLLRHDPDVILVGEMRDMDSGLAAVNAAITGHFVMATLHANDSVSAVHRLLALGVPAVLIASSLCGVLSQRLVRLTCKTCGGKKCNACRNTGYSGRKLIAELIRPRPTFGSMLTQTSSYSEILEHVEYVGPTLNQALVTTGRAGLTDWPEIRQLCSSHAELPDVKDIY